METSSAPMQRLARFYAVNRMKILLGFLCWSAYTTTVIQITRSIEQPPTVIAYVMACGDDGRVIDLTPPVMPVVDPKPATIGPVFRIVNSPHSGFVLTSDEHGVGSWRAPNNW